MVSEILAYPANMFINQCVGGGYVHVPNYEHHKSIAPKESDARLHTYFKTIKQNLQANSRLCQLLHKAEK